MQQVINENKISDIVNQQLNLIKLPAFIKKEIDIIFGRLNDYKISNINKNMDVFLLHLNSLSQIYNKEFEKLYLVELGFRENLKNRIEKFNIEFKKLSKDKISYINYMMPKQYIRKFGNLYFNTKSDLSLEEYFLKQINFMAQSRFKILTILNLSILEYANSPSRIVLFQKIMKK